MDDQPLRIIAPPPVAYIAALVAGVVVHVFTPLRLFPEYWIGQPTGWPVVVAGLALLAWGAVTMKRAGESPEFKDATRTIVDAGPFRFTRNPLYTGVTLAYLGFSLVSNSFWPLIFIPLPLAFTQFVVMRGERYLEARLGDEYRSYRHRVRRWL